MARSSGQLDYKRERAGAGAGADAAGANEILANLVEARRLRAVHPIPGQQYFQRREAAVATKINFTYAGHDYRAAFSDEGMSPGAIAATSTLRLSWPIRAAVSSAWISAVSHTLYNRRSVLRGRVCTDVRDRKRIVSQYSHQSCRAADHSYDVHAGIALMQKDHLRIHRIYNLALASVCRQRCETLGHNHL